jgi:hypothetical protein
LMLSCLDWNTSTKKLQGNSSWKAIGQKGLSKTALADLTKKKMMAIQSQLTQLNKSGIVAQHSIAH